MLTVRPRATDLVFQLYGRPLHPELFELCQTRTLERNGYWARIEITTAGHVVTWRYAGLTLSEVCTTSRTPLPQKRRLMSYKLRGQRNDKVECRGGVTYHTQFELEPVDAEIFWTFQQELAQNAERVGMLHTFEPVGRLGLGPLSYVNVETRNSQLRIQAFHTFPDDFAIVKSESTFELP